MRADKFGVDMLIVHLSRPSANADGGIIRIVPFREKCFESGVSHPKRSNLGMRRGGGDGVEAVAD